MPTLKDIAGFLENIAPLGLQESYDNAGLITGDVNSEIKSGLVTLDVTEKVVEEAIQKIDHETKALFKATFDQVNSHLQQLFPKIFGGGAGVEYRHHLGGKFFADAGLVPHARYQIHFSTQRRKNTERCRGND